MLLVNHYGAPGASKTSLTKIEAGMLSMKGYTVETALEYAKDKVWEGDDKVFLNQPLIFGKQLQRIIRCQDDCEIVISDSPLLLSAYYGKNDSRLGQEFATMIKRFDNSYNDQINYFVRRVKPYNPKGRFQTEAESDAIALELQIFLKENGVKVVNIPGALQQASLNVQAIELHLAVNLVKKLLQVSYNPNPCDIEAVKRSNIFNEKEFILYTKLYNNEIIGKAVSILERGEQYI